MSAETDRILDEFTTLLAGPTGDGKNKRDAGLKAHWTVDNTHADAMLRHLGRWWNGERVDADSGSHPLVHLAWRALAVAYQETHAPEDGAQQFWQDVKDSSAHGPSIRPVKITHIEQVEPNWMAVANRG